MPQVRDTSTSEQLSDDGDDGERHQEISLQISKEWRMGGEGLGGRASVPRSKVDTSTAVSMGRRDGPVFTRGGASLDMEIPGFKYLRSTPENICIAEFQTQHTCTELE